MTASVTLPATPTLRERVAIRTLSKRPEHQTMLRDACAESYVFFVNSFGFTFDPREDAPLHDVPFMLYDFQIDYAAWMDERIANLEDGVVEKSRDMGVTWVTLSWLVWRWLFKDGFQALIGSRKEDLVDNWTLDSHFGKIAYFIEKLPKFLLPNGFSLAQHRMKLKLVNPENGNVIIGESANSEFSRQGRYSVIVFDEAAFWTDLKSSFRAAAQATRTRILISTPNGLNEFYRIRDSGQHRVLTLHWSLHPLKDMEWYRRECARMSVEDIAQELDINYQRSAKGVVYPTFATLARGEYSYERGWSLFCGWDFGISDDTAIIWFARNPEDGRVRILDGYSNSNRPIDFYVPFVTGFIADDNTYDYSADEMLMIHSHAGLPRAMHYGDPDVHKRGLATGTSAFTELQKHNIVIITNSLANKYAERKRKSDLLIKRIEGINWPNAAGVYESLTNARFPPRNPDSRSTAEIAKPIHDWTEAYRSAFEYFAVNEPLYTAIERPAPVRREMAYDRIQ